jgi:hypothetical protein
MIVQPCFRVQKIDYRSFRGSLSGLGFAYCDFYQHNPRADMMSRGAEPRTRMTSRAPGRAAPVQPAPVQPAPLGPVTTAPMAAPAQAQPMSPPAATAEAAKPAPAAEAAKPTPTLEAAKSAPAESPQSPPASANLRPAIAD